MKGIIDVDCEQSLIFPLSHIRSRERARGDKKQGCHNLSSLNKACTINLGNITILLMAHGSEKRRKTAHCLFIMVKWCMLGLIFFSHNGHFLIHDVSTAYCWSLICDGVNLLCGIVCSTLAASHW